METTDKQNVKSKKDAFGERLRAKYPDQNLDQEEDFFGRVNDDYDDYEKRLSEYEGRENQLSDMFSADPRSAAFLTNWRKGEDPAVQLVRMFGTEIKDAIDDPEKLDAISKANEEYVKRVSEEKDLDAQYEQNMQASLDMLEKMQGEKGLSDEQIDAAMKLLSTIATDFIVGKITPETVDMMLKAINHDQDVATAAEDAEVKGRNAKIDEKLRKAKQGDGVAQLNGKNGMPGRSRRQSGAIDNYEGRKSIWELGEERRRKG